METSISTFAKGLSTLIRHLPNIAKFYSYIFPKDLNGVWCICWKNAADSPKYQIGTMDIKQLSNIASGFFYSRDKKWSFNSKVVNGEIAGEYIIGKNKKGYFKFRLENNTKEFGRIKGKWSGEVYKPESLSMKPLDAYGLDFYGARNQACNPYCHLREFGEEEGQCTRY